MLAISITSAAVGVMGLWVSHQPAKRGSSTAMPGLSQNASAHSP